MTFALWCLVGALAILPLPMARCRRDLLYSPRKTPVRIHLPPAYVAAAACVAAAIMLGPLAAASLAILLATLLFRWRSAGRNHRHQRECQCLLAGLEILIAELRVGTHPAAAAAIAAEECLSMTAAQGPVPAPPSRPSRLLTSFSAVGFGKLTAGKRGNMAAVALGSAAARARLGGSAAAALEAAALSTQITSAELSRIAKAWHVADTHGLALAELLIAARTDLLGRVRFRGRTDAALAGARASATVLAGLPLLGIALGELMGAGPLQVLGGHSSGGFLLLLGSAFVSGGLLWTDAITRKVLA